MKILAIDTSGRVASAALTADGLLLGEKTLYTRLTHSQIILPMVKELLSDCGLDFGGLDAVVCAAGPGSYTGLRIGIAAVKGICMGAPQLKCAAISTLAAIAQNSAAYRGVIAVTMRARPDVVYLGIYRSDGKDLQTLVADGVYPEPKAAELIAECCGKEGGLLSGDICAEMKRIYFSAPEYEGILCAPAADRLQKASSLCAIFERSPQIARPPEALAAAYLQETKATKLKKTSSGGTP